MATDGPQITGFDDLSARDAVVTVPPLVHHRKPPLVCHRKPLLVHHHKPPLVRHCKPLLVCHRKPPLMSASITHTHTPHELFCICSLSSSSFASSFILSPPPRSYFPAMSSLTPIPEDAYEDAPGEPMDVGHKLRRWKKASPMTTTTTTTTPSLLRQTPPPKCEHLAKQSDFRCAFSLRQIISPFWSLHLHHCLPHTR